MIPFLVFFVASLGFSLKTLLQADSCTRITSIKCDDFESLSHHLSSPERFASTLNMTVDAVETVRAEYHQAVLDLNRQLAPQSGPQRHALLCAHRYRHGRGPFVCPNCWCYQPVCLCREIGNRRLSIPIRRVVIWTHHDEWGSVSNTGSLLPLLLEKTELLLKGYEPHDQRLAELQKEETLPVVLWTDHNKNQDSCTYYTIDEVRELETPITLFVMEGTWRNARRMVGKLPHDSRLSLRRDDLFWEGKSLLVPLRRQHGGPKDNLCTAEAVVAALVGLGMPLSSGNTVLAVVAGKIDLIRRYQGKILRES